MVQRSNGDDLLRIWLIVVGSVATLLAVAGALLPGLPATPFVLVAMWAFARSSERLYGVLERIPVLRHGLAEANRFDERRAIRLPVKILALTMAWGSAAVTAILSDGVNNWLVIAVVLAAIAATISMILIPTDDEN